MTRDLTVIEFAEQYLDLKLHPYQAELVEALLNNKTVILARRAGYTTCTHVAGKIRAATGDRAMKSLQGKHYLQIYVDEGASLPINPYGKGQINTFFPCPKCVFTATSEEGLENHMSVAHGIDL